MNIKYITSEMGFKGKFPKDYPYMRVFESQIYYLDATHLPITEILMNDKKYDGDLWWNIGKGGFEKQYISYLFNNFQNTTELLKRKFDNVFIYQDGEIGWWNQVDVKLQVWWYNQLSTSDKIFVPNETDVDFYKGMFPDTKIGVMRSVMTDDGLDKSKFLNKEDRAIVSGPCTYEYNGFPQVILASNLGIPIDIPPMGQDRMPKDSWEMAENIGVNYLEYMTWIDWMYNLSRYSYGFMLMNTTASGSFALNCAYHGIPCIGDIKADTQRILFPELSVGTYEIGKGLQLLKKLKNDKVYYNDVSQKAKEMYDLHFTKEEYLNILNKDF
jgi:hypothetical protein|tara:strand:- start:878 stop:1858 length:981 start_codon:yes stop_codon:yes gene_type:complete